MTSTEPSKARDACVYELAFTKALLDMIDEVCFALDHNFNITYVNRFTTTSFEKDADELIGRQFTAVFPYIKAVDGVNAMQNHLINNKSLNSEIQSPFSGRTFSIRAVAFQHGYLFYMRELTAEKRYQELLLEKDTRFLAITNAMSDFILIVEPSGRISYASQAARQFSGFTADEFEDEKLFKFIAPEHLESAKSDFKALMKSPEDDSPRVFKMKHKDGGQLELHAVDQNQFSDKIDGMILKYHP